MTDKLEWSGRAGQSWAAEWERTDRSFEQLTHRLLNRIDDCHFQEVLDVGCGAGELSIAVSDRAPAARVCGLDISADLINVARSRSTDRDNLSFEIGDASVWKAPCAGAEEAKTFDLAISRHGVMFFDDPPAAFANIKDLTAPGAQLLFSCFRRPSENPFFSEVGRLLPPSPNPVDPAAPGPFAFADQARVRRILSEAGWVDIEFEAYDYQMIAGSGGDPVSDAIAYFSRIGPAARAMAEMEDGERAQTKRAISQLARENLNDGVVALKAAVWIVSASNG